MITKTFAGISFREDFNVGDAISFTTYDDVTIEQLEQALLEVVDAYPFGTDEWILNAYDADNNDICLKLYASDEYFCNYLSIESDGVVKRVDNTFAYNEVRKKHYV